MKGNHVLLAVVQKAMQLQDSSYKKWPLPSVNSATTVLRLGKLQYLVKKMTPVHLDSHVWREYESEPILEEMPKCYNPGALAAPQAQAFPKIANMCYGKEGICARIRLNLMLKHLQVAASIMQYCKCIETWPKKKGRNLSLGFHFPLLPVDETLGYSNANRFSAFI